MLTRNLHLLDDTQARRHAVAKLIRAGEVSTQEELRELLLKQGFDVTQATLSRDLARLGARRVSSPRGGTSYELPPPASHEPLRDLRELVLDIADNGALVVVHTTPGAAAAVAHALDHAALDEVLGTIAGDDTVFIAPARASAAGKLTRKLKTLIGRT